MEKLFAYGNLREEDIQETVFGRLLTGIPETLMGYAVKQIKIEEEYGIESYPIIESTENKQDTISGMVYEVSVEELQLADRYEGKHYKRIQVQLKSNQAAWAFTAIT
ncbi:gamma-glutamylcyclotransferase family protein [Flavobacterium frigoris]|uniref:Gamma-glutamylcyclotransferase AIG2-like domain-containing protein n=1 Tax=Flavobacterium frigoris (strain PS1) TaxID=1086011 RepID=H7FS15_FLAFP|nr:gamma-glutamylcyclotransferase family protein [Flavobacterium frigoris]EIA08444.1 hypothetical protein HJ01_02166 [Flavobacterium frigoris PS1]